MNGPVWRDQSPVIGGSIFKTSAPKLAKIRPHDGPETPCATSITFIPSRGNMRPLEDEKLITVRVLRFFYEGFVPASRAPAVLISQMCRQFCEYLWDQLNPQHLLCEQL